MGWLGGIGLVGGIWLTGGIWVGIIYGSIKVASASEFWDRDLNFNNTAPPVSLSFWLWVCSVLDVLIPQIYVAPIM